MVARFVAPRGVDDPRVLEAMNEVPRHLFVPEPLRARAYGDHSLPIGHGQTISQPYVVGVMTQRLGISPEHKVLEIGSGSGYQTAVLAKLARSVYSLERIDELARGAAALLASLGFHNVSIKAFDGTYGYPAAAPYDRIIVTAGTETVPGAAARAAGDRRPARRADRAGRKASAPRHPPPQDGLRAGRRGGRDVRPAPRPLRREPGVMARRAVVRGRVQGVGYRFFADARGPRARRERLGPQPAGRLGRDVRRGRRGGPGAIPVAPALRAPSPRAWTRSTSSRSRRRAYASFEITR